MFNKSIFILLLLFFTGCGGGGGSSSSGQSINSNTNSNDTNITEPQDQIIIKTSNNQTRQNGFSYKTQKEVDITISSNSLLSNKQIVFYELKNTISTPVGDLEKLENILIKKVFDKSGNIKINHTLGNHVSSIWMSIPYYNFTAQIPVKDNKIDINLNLGELK